MTTKVPPKPMVSPTSTAMSQAAERLHQHGNEQLKKSGEAAKVAIDNLATTIAQTNIAASDALNVAGDVVVAGGHAVAGVGLAAAGAIVKATEAVGDLLGAALQHLGRALISAGNWLRSHFGGAQIVVSELESGAAKDTLSDRLLG